MKITLVFKIIFWILLLVNISSCEKPSTDIIQDPEFFNSLYTNAIDTLGFESHKYFLETSVWRDFMPTYPYNGKPPLTATINLVNSDSVPASKNLEIDKVYIINTNLIWISSPTENIYENVPEFKIHRVCQNGPPWDIGIQVDVIVKILDKASKQEYLLIARRQYIFMLD